VSGPLIVGLEPGGRRPVLLCLPPAGAGAGQFRAWQSLLGPDVAVCGLQLPGREQRWDEPPATELDAVVAEAATVLLERAGHAPLVIAGFSFGGLIGYEIARALQRAGKPPALVVVTACKPPAAWVRAGLGLLDDEQAMHRLVEARAGSDDDAFAELDADMRELMLDVLRHDAVLSTSYRYRPEPLLSSRLWACGGRSDGTVSAADLAGWDRYAGGGFERTDFDGDHYFWLEPPAVLLDRLRHELPAGSPH
jgi:surfactin synthase thioesterase subunit